MSRKMYWGLSVLIVIFIAGGAFVLVKQQRELAELRQGVAEANKLLEEHQKQQTVAANQPPRPAQEGFEWEWHGDHWHEMPVTVAQAEGEAPQQTHIDRPTQATHPAPTYKGPLTYHAELLETNPIEALRLQGRELNHWSTDYIPDFPPDDQLAFNYAQVEYLKRYIKITGEIPPGVNQAQLDRSFKEFHLEYSRILRAGGHNWQDPNNRINQLTKLTWIGMDPPLRWSDDNMALWQ